MPVNCALTQASANKIYYQDVNFVAERSVFISDEAVDTKQFTQQCNSFKQLQYNNKILVSNTPVMKS